MCAFNLFRFLGVSNVSSIALFFTMNIASNALLTRCIAKESIHYRTYPIPYPGNESRPCAKETMVKNPYKVCTNCIQNHTQRTFFIALSKTKKVW